MSDFSSFVVLAICRTKKGFLQAFFFDADFFRFRVCESKHIKIVYTVFLLRSACPSGVVIYDYSDINPCAFCETEECDKCPCTICASANDCSECPYGLTPPF